MILSNIHFEGRSIVTQKSALALFNKLKGYLFCFFSWIVGYLAEGKLYSPTKWRRAVSLTKLSDFLALQYGDIPRVGAVRVKLIYSIHLASITAKQHFCIVRPHLDIETICHRVHDSLQSRRGRIASQYMASCHIHPRIFSLPVFLIVCDACMWMCVRHQVIAC